MKDEEIIQLIKAWIRDYDMLSEEEQHTHDNLIRQRELKDLVEAIEDIKFGEGK